MVSAEMPNTSSTGSRGLDRKPNQWRCRHVRQTRFNPRDVETVRLQRDQAFRSDLEGDRPKERPGTGRVPVQDLRRYRLEAGVAPADVTEPPCANMWANSVRDRMPSLL